MPQTHRALLSVLVLHAALACGSGDSGTSTGVAETGGNGSGTGGLAIIGRAGQSASSGGALGSGGSGLGSGGAVGASGTAGATGGGTATGGASNGGATGSGGSGGLPQGSACANDSNCSQAQGAAVCCAIPGCTGPCECRLAANCPPTTSFLECNSGADCAAYGGGKVCCREGSGGQTMQFCTKPSGCTGTVLP